MDDSKAKWVAARIRQREMPAFYRTMIDKRWHALESTNNPMDRLDISTDNLNQATSEAEDLRNIHVARKYRLELNLEYEEAITGAELIRNMEGE